MPLSRVEGLAFAPQVQAEILSPTPGVPAVVEMFDEIRKPEVTPLAWLDEYSPATYFNSPLKLGFYFHEAKAAWEYAYDEERVKEALDTPDNHFSETYLKLLRRLGLIFRSSYKMFDGWHIEPESLAVFVGKLGACNDWIKNTGMVPDGILSEDDFYALRYEKFGYEPSSVQSHRRHTLEVVALIEPLTYKRIVGIKEFHQARKQVRHLMNTLQIPACFEPGKPIHSLFLEHHHVSQKMGDIHDQAVTQTLGQAGEYSRISVVVPEDIKQDLKTICSRHAWAH